MYNFPSHFSNVAILQAGCYSHVRMYVCIRMCVCALSNACPKGASIKQHILRGGNYNGIHGPGKAGHLSPNKLRNVEKQCQCLK